MNDISMVTGASLESVREAAPVRSTSASAASARTPERARDRIDISEMARLLSKMQGVPPIRQELVDRVRAEIERGEYETPLKVDEAARRLQQELSEDLDLLA